MKTKNLFMSLIFMALALGPSRGASAETSPEQPVTQSPGGEYNYFIGSTFAMLGNLSPVNTPDFVQLNLGRRIAPKSFFAVELKTWKYSWPIGIPFGDSWEDPAEKYPNDGYVREFGVTLVYQYFWWKNAFLSIDAMNALQRYYENGKFVQNGYILFMSYRLGYQFKFFRNRFFIEPSIACTYWPIRTNAPASFAKAEEKWPNYFLFEPGLHFGFNLRL